MDTPEYYLYKSRSQAVKILLLSSLFVAAGIFMLAQADASIFLSWFCFLFFCMGIPIGLFQFFDRRLQIAINELGIFGRTIHYNFIK